MRFKEEPPEHTEFEETDTHIDLKLGLLVVGGTYSTVVCPVGNRCPPAIENLSASNISLACVEGNIELHIVADQEGPLREVFQLKFLENHSTLSISISAKVMRRTKGTPSLKSSVRCLGFLAPTDSEALQGWQSLSL